MIKQFKEFKKDGRYLVSEDYIKNLIELTILEISEKGIKIKYDNENSQWYLKDNFPYKFIEELPIVKQTIEDRSHEIQFDDDWYESDEPQFNLKLTEENDIKVEKKSKLEWEQNPSKNIKTWNQADEYAKSLGDGWRLPTVEELENAYNNKVRGFKPDYYWSSITSARDTNLAWLVDFLDGAVYDGSKTSSYYVRYVRDIENKIVKEIEKPKLEWEQNPSKNIKTWDQAMEYAKSLGEGWRLPTRNELLDAYDNDVQGFLGRSYWSSSTLGRDNNRVWCLKIWNGERGCDYKMHTNWVRCVREVM